MGGCDGHSVNCNQQIRRCQVLACTKTKCRNWASRIYGTDSYCLESAGIGFRKPMLALAMTVFMLSLGGIPPTAGFMGKFWLFSAAIDSGYYWLALIGVLMLSNAAGVRPVTTQYDGCPWQCSTAGSSLGKILNIVPRGTTMFLPLRK